VCVEKLNDIAEPSWIIVWQMNLVVNALFETATGETFGEILAFGQNVLVCFHWGGVRPNKKGTVKATE
jgi:hypothetical protein